VTQKAVLEDIAMVLIHSLPPGWNKCRLQRRAVGSHRETTLWVERIGGEKVQLTADPALLGLLDRLRTVMYEPGKGTWFTARFEMTFPFEYRAGYVDDDEPAWDIRPLDEDRAEELRLFPRDQVPTWLEVPAEPTANISALLGTAPVDKRALDPKHAQEQQTLTLLRQRLADLSVDPSRYRIEESADQVWCMDRDGDTWTVFWPVDGEPQRLNTFDHVAAACAHLLGNLLLMPATPPPPIEPLPGEPPLRIFESLTEQTLPEGTKLDRFGTPDGNVLYDLGTHYRERSLPPEWINRAYHVYLVRRPLRARIGPVLPWFDQPGGGTAYILPAAVEVLLASGHLEELP
jgi:hypothetical protein